MNVDQTQTPIEVLRINHLDQTVSTEKLEEILRMLSDQVEAGKRRFHEIHEELKRRKETKDEQPPPRELTAEQRHQEELDKLQSDMLVLTNKSIAMESEQAKLVVEAVFAREALREAEDRLAIVVRHNKVVPKKVMDELSEALFGVPPGGASGDAPPWIIRLHRAACEVAKIAVVTKTTE